MNKKRIAIFASGNGTNAEEIIKYFKGHPQIEVSLIATNNPQAYVVERAKSHQLPYSVFNKSEFTSGTVVDQLRKENISHIVLAGFLWLIPPIIIHEYANRIINIHPALLPAFGGKGMFGMKVHEAVKAAGVKETGITIHLVNEHYDEGKVVFQARWSIEEDASVEEISDSIHALEYKYYAPVIERWITEA